ncbi:hypothetical protein A3715_05640 [Oleiphilus sp. HI0009]|uniref:rod shape-determining protein MreD n=1 Tax=unclassified Oleiphilus TaxID=2631174 RepID=UPI0007C28A69|nr:MULTISPECIES: rod shape-determining protein MreD [unclassified Oleiphilus]KZX77267.1 hypothetical protein A3715_21290 [Oleiphilus sp. HI0009]MCH2157596.1 rod shape-determining protein MreD [Oleiphilaceae bacterium]KZX82772.1 hypothetical protein A3715_05640 [Oleiphilus sp. HI0009]KZY65438.1 hypothetical protein A3738_08675 [Oleiphilus sp. HI0066]KZY70820.1 hypothetical protein A3738_24295 [Oleiphilus sp. HI0066]
MIYQPSMLAVVITFMLSVILELIYLPAMISLFRPEWLVMTVFFWTLRSPSTVGITVGFFIGLLLDVISGVYLGINALALSIVSYLAIGMHKRFKLYPLLQQSLVAFVVVIIHLLIVNTFTSLLSRAEAPSDLLLRAMFSGFLWPILVVVYDRISFALRG